MNVVRLILEAPFYTTGALLGLFLGYTYASEHPAVVSLQVWKLVVCTATQGGLAGWQDSNCLHNEVSVVEINIPSAVGGGCVNLNLNLTLRNHLGR